MRYKLPCTLLLALACLTACGSTAKPVPAVQAPPVCRLTPDGSTCSGNECHGELICCDKASGGCFCADSRHGAVCPAGSVQAPEMGAAPAPDLGPQILAAESSGSDSGSSSN